jgi:hypothetical protein
VPLGLPWVARRRLLCEPWSAEHVVVVEASL